VLSLYAFQMGFAGWGFLVESPDGGLGFAAGQLHEFVKAKGPLWAQWVVDREPAGFLLLVFNICAKYFLVFLPFLLMMLLSWAPMLNIDRFLRGSTWRMRAYLSFKLRNDILILLAPALLFQLIVDLMDNLKFTRFMSSGVYVPLFSTGVAMLVVYLLAPFLMVCIWVTRPFPAGALRDRLYAVCGRAGVKFRRLLIWDTMGGSVGNACVTGLMGPTRYILITDTLLQTMNDDEVEAVFGHELGHARFLHFPFFFEFILSMIFVSAAIRHLAGWLVQNHAPFWIPLDYYGDISTFLAMTLTVGVYFGIFFGMASRRFERQADIFGAFVINNVSAFSSALMKVARLNGAAPDTPSWRHYSIAKRIDFLERARTDPKVLAGFERELKILFIAFAALTALAVVFTVILELGII